MKILSSIYSFYFNFLFSVFILLNKNKKLLILDLDNTLAFTYQSLINNKYNTNKSRLKNLKANKKMIDFIHLNYPKDQYSYLLLSYRHFDYYFTTIKWLKKNNIFINWYKVIFVSNVKDKLLFLIKTKFFNVVYIDDLSYNHENNDIRYYNSVILDLKKMNWISYLGYKEIIKITEN